MMKNMTSQCVSQLKVLLELHPEVTNEQVMETLCINKISFNRWYNGKYIPNIKVLLKAGELFHTNISYILGLTSYDYECDHYSPNIRLEQLLKERKITRKEFAKETSLSQATVCNYANNKGNCTQLNILLAMALQLDVSLDYLLGLTSYTDWTLKDIQHHPLHHIKRGTPFYIEIEDGFKAFGLKTSDGEKIIFPNGEIFYINDFKTEKPMKVYQLTKEEF